jgi:peptidoglycan/LPS O-acetylase OafA/YrhL
MKHLHRDIDTIPADRNQFPELDFLRFGGVLAILFFHYTFRGFAADNETLLSYPFLAPVTKYGYLGVHLTFMISGFVILMSVQGKSAAQFLISRIARLYPVFWFCCSMTFLLSLIIRDPRHTYSISQYLLNMTMLNEFVGVDSIDGAYWILPVQIVFYFWIGLILRFHQLHRVGYLLGIWLCIAMLSTAYEVKYLGVLFISSYAAYFIAGASCFLVYFEGITFYRVVLVSGCYVVALVEAAKNALALEAHFDTQFSPLAISFVITLFFISLFLLAATRKRFFKSRFLWLGSLTYPLYLIHQHAGYMLFNFLYSWINVHVLLWGTVIGMVLLSRLIHTKFESVYSMKLKLVCESWLEALPSFHRKPASVLR